MVSTSKKDMHGLYTNYKEIIRQETWIRNSKKDQSMVRARANALDLKCRGMNEQKIKTCPLCQETEESMEHFIPKCCKQ